MERLDARNILEALLFITDQPIALKSFVDLFDKEFSPEDLRTMVEEMAADYQSRGSALELREIAGGWQFSSRTEFAPWIRKLFKDRLTYRLSASALETLSIVAYKQPITRSEIEEIRGVEVSAVLDTLMERRLIRIAGRRESVGRPILYGTTPDFLKAFVLKGLEELPSIESLTPPAVSDTQSELPLSEGLPLPQEEPSPAPSVDENDPIKELS
jgi:segregation and condensation protein B